MKMKMKRLALTAILLSSTSMSLAADPQNNSVGDLPGFGEDAYFDDGYAYDGDPAAYAPEITHNQYADEAYADEADGSTESQASADQPSDVYQADDQINYAPIGVSALQPVQYQDGYQGDMQTYVSDGGYAPAPACGCENGCDSGCDGGCDSIRKIRRQCGLKAFDCNTWATYEALLWFPQARKLPVLVASADPGELPILGPGGSAADGVTTLFGGEIDGGLSAGFRADYGKWLSCDFGIGGRFWWLGENGDSYSGTDLDGADGSVGRPFFNSNPVPNGVGEDALLIAYLDADREFTGDVSAESTLDILAAELYGRFRLGSSACHQLDMIGGYSHFRIDDKLRMSSTTTTIDSLPLEPAPGTVRSFYDSLDAENRFHGGQLGFELSATRGCWMVRSLTKVHLGNMEQTYTSVGRREFQSPPPNPGNPPTPPAVSNDGMYVQTATRSRDVFAFAPEANFKIAYRFRPNVLLSVGYSFIYFDNLALNGSVLDRTIDGQSLEFNAPPGERPAFVFDDDNLFVHGIDLGAVIDF